MMETFKRDKWFWVLQVLGWGFVSGVNSLGKLTVSKSLNSTYIIIEGSIFFLTGIFSSGLLRRYLKNRLDFSRMAGEDYKVIAKAYVIFSLVFFSSILLTLPFYHSYHDRPLPFFEVTIVSNLINSFVIILFWLVFYLSIKLYILQGKNRIKQLQLENALKEAKLNTLKGQINPHFMFNSMNNIRGLILEDAEKAREMLTRLSELLRFALTKSEMDVIPLEEELTMVHHYVSLSRIHLEERLRFEEDIDPTLAGIGVPPMLLQMLIENAIKHGIAKLPEGGSVLLSISRSGDMAVMRVKNTGSILKGGSGTHVGLDNIKKRLHLLYADSSAFDLKSEGGDVIATVKIPLS